MSAEWAIRIEKMSKRYKGEVAVDSLSLDVPIGSVYGLLGENGAGKSTTIKSVLGLVQPDSGRVETLGLDPSRYGLAVRRQVGYVPEQPSLYDTMTVGEIGWFASGFRPECPGGLSGFRTRYDRLIAGFDLPSKRKIKALSKGMRAKVGLALALAPEPGLLVLDEPTSGLDILVRRDFLESMIDLAGEGRSVLLSSHQISEVERVASHVALIHKGKLILAEPLDALKARTFVILFTSTDTHRPPSPPSDLWFDPIDVANDARQTRWLVHAPSREALEPLRDLPGVMATEIMPANLEEIYLGYMRRRLPAANLPIQAPYDVTARAGVV